MYFEEIPDYVLKRQERVRALFRGETPQPPLAYLCPMSYARKKTGLSFDNARAIKDIEYLADFQVMGLSGVLETANDNTPVTWTRAGDLHFIDTLFGIQLAVLKSGIWGNPLDWDLSRGSLPEYDPHGGLVPRAIEEIELLRNRFGVLPIAPPSLSGPLNGALNIFGSQQILYLARRDPPLARRAIEHVAHAIIDVDRILSKVIGKDIARCSPKFWLPPEYITLPWCASQLVSRETYEDVIKPADEMILNNFEGTVLHICGRTTHLIPTIHDMKSVRGIELRNSPGGYDPTIDFEKYFDGLRDDQIIIVTAGRMTPRRIMEISAGERTIIVFNDVDELRSVYKI